MNRILIVAFAAVALSAAACSDNDNSSFDAGPIPDAGTTDAGHQNDGGVTDGGHQNDGGVTDGGVTDGGTTDGGTDGGVQGTATFSTGIPGVSNFTPVDAITTDAKNVQNSSIVAITDEPNACADAQSNTTRIGERAVAMQFFNSNNGTLEPLTTGDYAVTTATTPPAGKSVLVSAFEAANAANPTQQECSTLNTLAVATGGTVTVTSLNPGSGPGLKGTFSLQFPNQGSTTTTVTGTFTAPKCEADNAPANETCVQ